MSANYVRKRVSPNGVVRWEARYRDEAGKQRQESFRTKQAALKAQAERKADRLRGLARDEDKARDSFGSYADTWLDLKRTDVRARTIEGYEKDLRVHVLPVFGSKPVGKISRSDVLAWVETMKAKRLAGHSLSPRTIKAAHKRLEQVLGLAVLDGAIHFNAATGVPLPRLHAKAPKTPFKWRILSPTQQPLLIGAMDWSDGVVAATLLGTGLRAAELAGLQVGDIDIKRRTLSVERTKRYKAGVVLITPPKTEHSTRTVPLRIDLANALADWLAMHPLDNDPTAPLFPFDQDDWTLPIDMNRWRRTAFEPALVTAGLDPALRIHDLRHTYGTTLVEANTPIERVSRLMGHSAIHVTMLYTHLDTATYHDDVDAALPSLFTKRRLEAV